MIESQYWCKTPQTQNWTQAARNPSCCLVILIVRPNSPTILFPHSSEETETKCVFSLYKHSVEFSSSFSPSLYFSSELRYSVHQVNYVEASAKWFVQRGFARVECKEPLTHVNHVCSCESQNLDLLLQYQYPLCFIFTPSWPPHPQNLPDPQICIRFFLMSVSCFWAYCLSFFHFSLLLSTVREEKWKIHMRVYVCKDLVKKFLSVQGGKEAFKVQKFRWMFPSWFCSMIAKNRSNGFPFTFLIKQRPVFKPACWECIRIPRKFYCGLRSLTK